MKCWAKYANCCPYYPAGTALEDIWLSPRSKFCFLCETGLRNSCAKCVMNQGERTEFMKPLSDKDFGEKYWKNLTSTSKRSPVRISG